MNENRYAVGVDIGTSEVRVVVASVPMDNGQAESEPLTILGVGSCRSQGMRKGTVVDIKKIATSVDKAIGIAEEMSGFEISEALISINGTHINGRKSHGLVTVDHTRPIRVEDIDRAINAATQVKMPSNSTVIDVCPRLFKVDDQDGVRDPIDMEGLRLEVDIYMVTALAPHVKVLDQVSDQAHIAAMDKYVPSGVAASEIALTDQQRENGCVMIDIGYATTNIVVYEEGNIVDVCVLPVGSANITNDLAVGLKTDLDIAEQVKISHAVASSKFRRGNEAKLAIRIDNNLGQNKLEFDTELVDEIVEARLVELFELVNKELKRIKRQAGLPGGAVLTGGGANLRGIADLAKICLGMNARVYSPKGYKGVSEKVNDPSWIAVLGLVERAIGKGIVIGSNHHSNRPGLLGSLFSRLFRGQNNR